MPNQSCPWCGVENPQGAGFCMSCGTGFSEGGPWTRRQSQQVGRLAQSRLGIASFVAGLVSAVLFLVSLAAIPSAIDNAAWVLGVLACASAALLMMTALVLGIVGLFQKQRSRLFAVLGTVLSGGAIALALVFVSVTGGPPSDDKMISDFHKHKQDFVALLEMYQTDPALEVHAPGMKSEDVSGPRFKEYLDLRNGLGVLEPIGPGQDGGVEFTTSGYGNFNGGWAKGYVYSSGPLAPLVDNISESEPAEEWGRLYRHIEGDWYLYYGWTS